MLKENVKQIWSWLSHLHKSWETLYMSFEMWKIRNSEKLLAFIINRTSIYGPKRHVSWLTKVMRRWVKIFFVDVMSPHFIVTWEEKTFSWLEMSVFKVSLTKFKILIIITTMMMMNQNLNNNSSDKKLKRIVNMGMINKKDNKRIEVLLHLIYMKRRNNITLNKEVLKR